MRVNRYLIEIATCVIGVGVLLIQNSTNSYQASSAGIDNIEAIHAAGHPTPELESWWVNQPTPAELIASLVEPLKSSGSLCSGRLWLPRQDHWGQVDDLLIAEIEKHPTGPHQLAMCSHFHEFKGNNTKAIELMKEAKTWLSDEDRDARVYCSFRSRHLLSCVLAMDWIEWSDQSEFEQAFAVVRERILKSIRDSNNGKRNLRENGYWDATHTIESAYYLEQLLALSVCGVNPKADSDQWARLRLAELDNSENENPLYSTFQFCNVLSLLSRRGGGREYGQQEGGPGLGGYEQYFAAGAIIQIEAVDTATGRKWNLRNKNLYLQTRYLGLITEIDRTVARTRNSGSADGTIAVLARMFRDENSGKIYQWALGEERTHYHFREFQALAGRAPKPEPPDATPLVDRVGSRWHYRHDPSKPDSTFRMWITNRDLEHFRYGPDERCLSFCIGSIGLIDGHVNRTGVIGALANGVHFSDKTKNGNPTVATADFWGPTASHHPYWSPDRAKYAEPVLNDPTYLVGEDGPIENNGVWEWDRDYSGQITRILKSEIYQKVQHAQATYKITPSERRIEIVDTIRADRDIYVGWHFSPTHRVTLEKNGFRFGDSTDEIVVHIEGMDGTELQVTRRNDWVHDGYTLPLDWHETKGGPKRIAENIGYTPTRYQPEYKVRVVIQANPDK